MKRGKERAPLEIVELTSQFKNLDTAVNSVHKLVKINDKFISPENSSAEVNIPFIKPALIEMSALIIAGMLLQPSSLAALLNNNSISLLLLDLGVGIGFEFLSYCINKQSAASNLTQLFSAYEQLTDQQHERHLLSSNTMRFQFAGSVEQESTELYFSNSASFRR